MTRTPEPEVVDPVGATESATPGEVPSRVRRANQADGRRSPLRRWGVRAAGVAVVAGGLYWVGWHSQLTTVEEVRVVAPKGISEQAVRDASGIGEASHVPGVSARDVELAIMTSLPAVASVQVQRHLPHRVTLVVTARQRFAALAHRGGFLLLDSGGVAFDRTKSAKGLPIISATATDEGRAAALEVLAQIPDSLRSKIALIRAQSRDSVTFALRDTSLVRWGSPTDAELKAQVLAALLPVKAKAYDVSAPMLPTTQGSLEPEEDQQ